MSIIVEDGSAEGSKTQQELGALCTEIVDRLYEGTGQHWATVLECMATINLVLCFRFNREPIQALKTLVVATGPILQVYLDEMYKKLDKADNDVQ